MYLFYQTPDPATVTTIIEQGPWAVMALIAWTALVYFTRKHAEEKAELVKLSADNKAAHERVVAELRLEHAGIVAELKRQLDKQELSAQNSIKEARLEEREAVIRSYGEHVSNTNAVQSKHNLMVEKQVGLLTQMQQAVAGTQTALVEIKETMIDQRFEALEQLLRDGRSNKND